MKDGSLIAWLLEHSGPAIRYRTAAELLDPRPSPQELARVSQELEQSPLVQGWLANVGLSTGDTDLHGSKRTCFENAAGKLTQLGCHRGMAGYDACMAPFRRWLAEQVERPSIGDWSPYYGTLVAAALARGGYRDGAICSWPPSTTISARSSGHVPTRSSPTSWSRPTSVCRAAMGWSGGWGDATTATAGM